MGGIMSYRKDRYKFTKEEIDELMEKTKAKTPEEALEIWAHQNYDLKHRCDIQITKIGKTFIEITEYFDC